ncbi:MULTISPECIES: LysR family transcriptional regulator [Zhongshania]|jgi:DNA-binding transcriptional LysR family regulator|uniref:LysR family transcriptional regulator n=2 Tax=Zhongshania TaxID=1434050 RepID=A0A127MAZ6_9GAMM|nr:MULTISPECIES: LysR family transcriptional regulator [Zhongshania]AMO70421.1 LysR family transcriptional regulator [Zhongshania aliphaticivorans]
MHYTLRQLEVFLAAAHTENITRAAEQLSMSQSAASSALKDLEQQFSIQLFDRIGKRLQINELGRALRPQAEALLDQAQALEQGFRRHDQVGELKIGATLTIGNYLAVDIMAEFISRHPAAKVALNVANTAAISQQVLNFDLDVGLIEGELHHPDLEVTKWREDELQIFCSPSHPLATKKNLSNADLLSAQWILREPGSGTRQAFDRALHDLLPDLNIRLELQHTEAIKRAVETGLGIGCLSKVSLQSALETKRLVALDAKSRDFKRFFYFILHRQKYRSEGILRWLELCRNS